MYILMPKSLARNAWPRSCRAKEWSEKILQYLRVDFLLHGAVSASSFYPIIRKLKVSSLLYALINCARQWHNMLLAVLVYLIYQMIILVFVNYAQFRKTCRNYSSTFYFKFGKNTSITVQQTIKWQKHLPYLCIYIMYIKSAWFTYWKLWKFKQKTSTRTPC